MLIVITDNGTAARYVSKYRPPMPVLAATTNPQVARQLFLYRGITPLLLTSSVDGECVPFSQSLKVYESDQEDAICDIDGQRTRLSEDVHTAQLRDDLLEEAVQYARRMGICGDTDRPQNVVAVVGSATTGLAAMRSFIVR